MKTRPLMRWLLLAGLIAAAAGAAAFALTRPVQVRIATVETDVPIQIFGLGTVEARILSEIGFEVAGTLDALHADHGDTVTKGQTLAHLHSAKQEAQAAQAAANVQRARSDLARADARLERAQAIVDQRRQSDRRRQALLSRGTVSSEAAEDAQAELAIALADYAVARSEVAVARAALSEAEARLAHDRIQLEHHTLTAPFDGMVVARHREAGMVTNPGQTVFTIVDPATVWVLAHVDEAAAGGIQVGQPAEVRLRSLPGRVFGGDVARIDIRTDRISEERRVFVACGDCPANFFLGEQAEVLITTGRLDRGLLVPQTALSEMSEAAGTVWTLENGLIARRRVELGRRTLDGRVEIAGGLPEGAAVIVEPGGGLRVGREAGIRLEHGT